MGTKAKKRKPLKGEKWLTWQDVPVTIVSWTASGVKVLNPQGRVEMLQPNQIRCPEEGWPQEHSRFV